MYTTQLVKKFKRHGSNKRQRNARQSRVVPNNRINRFNLITLRNQIDATDFRPGYILGSPSYTRTINPMYKFITVDGDPPLPTTAADPIYRNIDGQTFDFDWAIQHLKWNDGIFWWFGSNYFETPFSTQQSASSVAPCTSNCLIQNRRLAAGNLFVDCEDDTFNLSANIQQVAPLPIIRGENINHIHQVSQRVKLQEQMAFQLDKVLALDHLDKFYVTRSVSSFVPAWNFNGFQSHPSASDRNLLAQQFGARDLLKFCVRNVCIQLPAYVNEDDDPDEYTKILRDPSLPAWQKCQSIEDLLLSEIFVTADFRCGPPTQSQRDLYAKINPKFKILRDYKQTFAPPPTTTTRPSPPKTTEFYHRYKTSKATQLETVAEQTPIRGVVTNASPIGLSPVNGVNIDITGFQSAVQAQDPENEPVQSIEQQVGDATMANRAQVLQTKSVSCYCPKSSRIVWLRFPRFANTWELSDIKNNTICVPPLADHYYDHALSTGNNQALAMAMLSAGTRITGYTEWKIMKPEGMGQPGYLGPPIVNNSVGELEPNEVGVSPIKKRPRT